MKKCPYCAEEIQDEAIVCRYCHKDLRRKNILLWVGLLILVFVSGFGYYFWNQISETIAIFQSTIKKEIIVNNQASYQTSTYGLSSSTPILFTQTPKFARNNGNDDGVDYYSKEQKTALAKYSNPSSAIEIQSPSDWRISMMDTGHDHMIDDNAIDSWKDYIAGQAKFWAIEPPYRWEIYLVENGKNFRDVSDYYKKELHKLGYQIAQDYFVDDKGFGAMSFIQDDKKVYVAFWLGIGNDNPQINVIYKNVDINQP